MIKRKFSFNIAPVKVPSKSDLHSKASPEPVPSQSASRSVQSQFHSHHRHHSLEYASPLDSPFISRQRIDPRTEQELRAACALILQHFKPSDHGLEDADPKLDFQCPNRRKERNDLRDQRDQQDHRDRREHGDQRSGATDVRVRQPTGAPQQHASSAVAKKQSKSRLNRADILFRDDNWEKPPPRANTGRRRADQSAPVEKGKHIKSPPVEHVRPAVTRVDVDSDDGKSVGTPLTASTDTHVNNSSTAPTSAALTTGRNSKRESHQFDGAARADAQATEWMRQQLEKKNRDQPAPPKVEKEPQTPSRSKSIRTGIKDYIFPGSAALSRAQSHETLSSSNNQTAPPKDLRRTASSHGWRSWGLQRKSSSRSSSRPNSSKGRVENQEQEAKPSINLNRELPPLPSLDSWKDEGQPKAREERKSQIQSAHIATVMRSSEQQQQQDYAAAVRKHHRRSGSDTLALRYANASYSQSIPQVGPVPPRKNQKAKERTHPTRGDSSMDFDDMMSAMKSTEQLVALSGAHKQSVERHSRSPSIKMSSDQSRLEAPVNFSRKISADIMSPRSLDHIVYPNQVQLGPSPQQQPQRHKSTLKKVFGGWMSKKEKKDNWMKQVEKNGVKNGVMIQDEAALPPVVRY
ncbi:hypothetical protein BU24DRAFT_178786 [Aaosphaeria arxii CBS 175.79]|uniref:Uncharacterized protein n=1 Tax=Aaosphaeria arxii CBS 175.79 TaxID=1450172 RepID=A0A6A5XRC6_9PLEO|nr:uncharacterized protein BU24DRAFT_178786 [Aaosphaeria arxii CBS 175.79]KAF2015446.1 hypothetical protein BU24DRAFT_178786 [Aaosphaeria arxii CBS 175.79]